MTIYAVISIMHTRYFEDKTNYCIIGCHTHGHTVNSIIVRLEGISWICNWDVTGVGMIAFLINAK